MLMDQFSCGMTHVLWRKYTTHTWSEVINIGTFIDVGSTWKLTPELLGGSVWRVEGMRVNQSKVSKWIFTVQEQVRSSGFQYDKLVLYTRRKLMLDSHERVESTCTVPKLLCQIRELTRLIIIEIAETSLCTWTTADNHCITVASLHKISVKVT